MFMAGRAYSYPDQDITEPNAGEEFRQDTEDGRHRPAGGAGPMTQ